MANEGGFLGMKWSRERYRMTARIYICSRCAKYNIACDVKKTCPIIEDQIDKWMEEKEKENAET